MVKSIITFVNLEGMVEYVKNNCSKDENRLTVYIVSESEVRLFSELDEKGNRELFACACNCQFPEIEYLDLKAVLSIREYLKTNLKEYPDIKIIA